MLISASSAVAGRGRGCELAGALSRRGLAPRPGGGGKRRDGARRFVFRARVEEGCKEGSRRREKMKWGRGGGDSEESELGDSVITSTLSPLPDTAVCLMLHSYPRAFSDAALSQCLTMSCLHSPSLSLSRLSLSSNRNWSLQVSRALHMFFFAILLTFWLS